MYNCIGYICNNCGYDTPFGQADFRMLEDLSDDILVIECPKCKEVITVDDE